MTATDIVLEAPLRAAARPWPGLDAFSEELQTFLFGRTAETEQLYRRIRGETLTLPIGHAGLGKTSLPLVPVLIFDQFEEVFTLGLAREASRTAAQRFLAELAELIENRPPDSVEKAIESDPAALEKYQFDRQEYRIVIALREDYFAQLDSVRERAPLIGRQGFDAVTRPVPGLIAPELAREILDFVGRPNPEDAFGPAPGEDGDGLEVEPALLSLFCRELNEKRLALGLDRVTPDLLAGSRETIIESFYNDALADQDPAVRKFVEDELLSDNGIRESVSLDRLGQQRTRAAA